MAEVQYRNMHGAPQVANAKKRKGFFSNLFGRSSNTNNKDEKEPKRKGLMGSLMNNARQEAQKEVMHLAEHEATKLVKDQFNNTNGSQTTVTNPTTQNGTPDTDMSDVWRMPVDWARRMGDTAQQKVQGLQQRLGS